MNQYFFHVIQFLLLNSVLYVSITLFSTIMSLVLRPNNGSIKRNTKTETLLRNGIRPILCVGESLEQRNSGNHEDVVVAQLRKVLAGFTTEDQSRCVLAYEPIWAIGTGKTATPEQANSMHSIIRKEIGSLCNTEVATNIQILYGGSVNVENAEYLLAQSEIDGALVGGASLKIEDFSQIIAAGA